MLPGGAAVKTPPVEGGGAGSIPGPEAKIPHIEGQLSLGAITTKDSWPAMKSPRDGMKEPAGRSQHPAQPRK